MVRPFSCKKESTMIWSGFQSDYNKQGRYDPCTMLCWCWRSFRVHIRGGYIWIIKIHFWSWKELILPLMIKVAPHTRGVHISLPHQLFCVYPNKTFWNVWSCMFTPFQFQQPNFSYATEEQTQTNHRNETAFFTREQYEQIRKAMDWFFIRIASAGGFISDQSMSNWGQDDSWSPA